MSYRPRVTLRPSSPNGDLRLADQGRLNALREAQDYPRLEPTLARLARLAALGTRCSAAFVAWVWPDRMRFMATSGFSVASGFSVEGAVRKLPARLELLFPREQTQFRAQPDLEIVAGLCGVQRALGFYAATPIRLYGYTLGVLAVLDAQSRQLDEVALTLLGDLAQSLSEDLERQPEPPVPLEAGGERRAVRSLGQLLPVALLALDARGIVRRAEGQSLEALKLKPAELLGQSSFELFAAQPTLLQAVIRALAGERLQVRLEWGGRPFHVWLVPDSPNGMTVLALDISDFQRAAPGAVPLGVRS